MVDPITAGSVAGLFGAALVKLADVALVALRRRNGRGGKSEYDPEVCRLHGEDIAAAKAGMSSAITTMRDGFDRIERRIESLEESLRK